MSSIVTNVAALNGQRNLNLTSMKMGKVLEKLSSGYRINRAADDAAGLGISEKMRAQIRGNSQAIRNAQDGISMIQTAEGAMDEVHGILQRMRELGVQAANDTYDTAARTSIGTELVQLRSEIDRIANATSFNGQNLLTGALTGTLGGATGTDLVVNDAVGAAIATGIEVSSAKPATYTFSSSGAGLITLTSSTGTAQQISIGAIAANGTQTLDFNQLGVKITLNSTAGESAANLDRPDGCRERHHRGDRFGIGGAAGGSEHHGVRHDEHLVQRRACDGCGWPEPEQRRQRGLDVIGDDCGVEHGGAGVHQPGRYGHHDAEHPPF